MRTSSRLGLATFLLSGAMALVGAADGEVAAAPPLPGGGGTLIMSLGGSFPLRPSSFLLQESGWSLFDTCTRLRQALKAPQTRLVLDLTNGFAPGLAAAEELAGVLRARPAGHTVACLLDNTSDSAYVVAAACDEVVMADAGILMVDGLAISSDYYGEALGRVGVKFHAITSGEAKTAPEPLTRSAPSPAAVVESQRLLDGLDAVVVADSKRRGFDAAALQAVRAQSPQTAAIAIAGKLVDRAVEPGAWLASQPAPISRFKVERNEPDLGSITGLMAFLRTAMNGDKGPRPEKSVAVVELEGQIFDGGSSQPGMTINGDDTAELFDRLADDAVVAAVVVRVDSGGGSADASDRIHYAIRRCAARKPVVALFDGVAASGGYYLGCAAHQILVHHGTITGSIGVFALMPDLDGTRDLLGIHRHTIASAPRATLFTTGGFGPEKEAALRQVISAVDARFQGIVAERRHLDPAKVKGLAGGKVYTGDEAVALGLADGIGDLVAAVASARQRAGIATPLPVERFPESGGLAARLGLTGSMVLAQAGVDGGPLAWWLALARAERPLVLAWSPVSAPR
jgi:protease-4